MDLKIIDDPMALSHGLSDSMGEIFDDSGVNARMARMSVSTASPTGELVLHGLNSSGAGGSASRLSRSFTKTDPVACSDMGWIRGGAHHRCARLGRPGSVFGGAPGHSHAVSAALVAWLAKEDHPAANLDLDLAASA